MSKQKIKQLIERRMTEDGMLESGVKGVTLFRVTNSVRCAPAVYEPCVVAIVSGSKEAILDANHYVYDENQYLCCSMTMPVEAGTPNASPENPLLGVIISFDTKVMTELAIQMVSGVGGCQEPKPNHVSKGLMLSHWGDEFTDALWRLLQLGDSPADTSVLGEGRLRELYYAVMKGEAGVSARSAFGVGNDIARSIQYLSSRLDEVVTIEDMASQLGMSRAVLHRKFKDATSMSPIQFMKSMRLNTAAMKIMGGMNVSTAAQEVGYVSSSQFSREFKRMYGQSPKEWNRNKELPKGVFIQ